MKPLKVLALMMLAVIFLPSPIHSIEEGRRELTRPGSGGRGGGGNGPRRTPVRDRERPHRIDPVAYLALDSDGDGLANSQDPCWATAVAADGTGAPQLIPGCTALDIIQMPDALSGRLTDAIDDAIKFTELYLGLASIMGDLESVLPLVDQAIAETRSGDPCGGQLLFSDAGADLLLVEETFASLMTDGYGALGEPTDLEDDVRPAEMDISDLDFLMSRVVLARDAALELEEAAGAVCDVMIPRLSTSGVVELFDDARQRMVMTDGRVFALTEGMDLEDQGAGQEVTITGFDLGNGTGGASTVTLVNPVGFGAGVFYSCSDLKIAPVQPFWPVKTGPYLLHEPRAYRYFNHFKGSSTLLRLEAGMRLAVENGCGDGSSFVLSGPRFSVGMQLTYVKKNAGTTSAWLAADLKPGMDPVALPADADPSFPATLTVIHKVTNCKLVSSQGISCDPIIELGRIQYTLHMVERGSMCNAVYEKTLFDINDREPGWFQKTYVKQLISFATGDGGYPPTFRGEGYGSTRTNPLVTTYPNISLRKLDDRFAIHTHDILPLFGGNNVIQRLLLMAAAGVDHAAGIVWPRAVGTRNLKPYQYSCTLPKVVRDVVNFCGNKPVDSYYHMPFPKNIQWNEGQGNLSPPGNTHSGGYAYDMIKGCGNQILAARGGRVIMVNESADKQVGKWCCTGQPTCAGCGGSGCCAQGAPCPGNQVRIIHQDGSVGQYVHMPQNGVLPVVGEVVRRGQLIATVGLSGNTSGPHLHFAARLPGSGGLTHLALFQAVDPGTAANPQPHLLLCYEPLEGQTIFSNNKICSTCPPQ